MLPNVSNATSGSSFNSAIGTGGSFTPESSLFSTLSKLRMSLKLKTLRLRMLLRNSRKKLSCAKTTKPNVLACFQRRTT